MYKRQALNEAALEALFPVIYESDGGQNRILEVRARELEDEGQPLYALRLRQRTRYDIEMMRCV